MNAIPRSDPSPELSPALSVFLRRLHASSTKLAYERELRRFCAWLVDGPPIDQETLPKYVEALRARDLSATTVAWRASVIASFLRDCHRQSIVAEDLVGSYRLPHGTKGFAPRVLSQGELKRLLRTPDRRSWQGKRDLVALVLMGVAGLRVGEVTRLRLCDITLQSDRVEIRVRGKGNRVRLVALSSKNAAPIRAWAATRGTGNPGDPWLLARSGEAKGLTVASIDYVVRKHAVVAQLENVHAHCLRHTAASLALSHGASLVQVRDLLGHSSIVTTSRYLHALNCEYDSSLVKSRSP
jgi:site-specific recombinase XerD